MSKKWTNKRALKLFVIILIFTTATDLICAGLFYNKVLTFISNQPENIKADAGVIFFGDATFDGKALGPDSKNRAAVAIRLFNDHKIRKIICVGGNSREIISKPKNLMRNYLVRNSIPQQNIIYDTLSYNTITNWQAGKRILDENRFSTAILISAPLHIYRIAHSLDFKGYKVYFASYKYRIDNMRGYYVLLKDIHHEWISLTLNKFLSDNFRNRLVFIIRDIKHRIKMVFLGND